MTLNELCTNRTKFGTFGACRPRSHKGANIYRLSGELVGHLNNGSDAAAGSVY
jgi:hypothetical protein